MSEWRMVPKRIGYRERLAFENVIGRALNAEEGQRLWDAMLAAGPDEWQPIDSAPTDGTEVLLYFPAHPRTHDGYPCEAAMRHGRYVIMTGDDANEGKWIGPYSDGFDIELSHTTGDPYAKPTHWMPRPSPPNSA